jgi:hypothetical protein
MIGKTKETSAPTILICSTDKTTRKTIRKEIKENGFLDNHPGLRLGDTTELPDRRQVVRMGESCGMDTIGGPSGSAPSRSVYTLADDDGIFGRRLITYTANSRPRLARGGPVIWMDGMSYQLTVGHIFEDNDGEEAWAPPPDGSLPSSDDCSFDGQSDTEDELEEAVTSNGSRTPEDLLSVDSEEEERRGEMDSTPLPSSQSLSTAHLISPEAGVRSTSALDKVGRSGRPIEQFDRLPIALPSDGNTGLQPKAANIGINPNAEDLTQAAQLSSDLKLRFLGVACCSVDGRNPELDYALVRVNDDRDTLISLSRGTQLARTWNENKNVCIPIGSKGFLIGKLAATASYIQVPGCGKFQEIFLVRLNSSLSKGDCGAPVFGRENGDFYGNIVVGTPETGLGYLVPAAQVLEDIHTRFGAEVTLNPPVEQIKTENLDIVASNSGISSRDMSGVVDGISNLDSQMPPTEHDRRSDGPSQNSQYLDELLAAARRDVANALNYDFGPRLDAIRGQGGTAIDLSQDDLNVSGHSVKRPAASEAETEASRMTIWDRGDAQYYEAYSTGSHRPEVKLSILPSSAPLASRLMSLRCWSSRPKDSQYYPKGSVEALMTAEEIASVIHDGRHELEKVGKRLTDKDIWEYAKRATHVRLEDGTESSFRRMFAILVLLRRGWDIVLFIDEGICDKHLPLKAVDIHGAGSSLPPEMRLEDDPDTPLACLSHWSEIDHEDFDRKQWPMLAPFFARAKRKNAWLYELPRKVVLPWIEKNMESGRQGGYAFVSKVEIHPSHHNFDLTNASDGMFAVKHFKSHVFNESSNGASTTFSYLTRREFENEIEILNRFSGDVHPHLISLQAAFRHDDEYCVILPWAEYDLVEFWKNTDPGSPLDKTSLLWVLDQCRGLASGLQSIHVYEQTESSTQDDNQDFKTEKVFGRHGDIKPANILLFRKQGDPGDRGRLVITDFGLSRFHSDGTKSYLLNKDNIPATLTYRPPECDLDECVISRSFDIWSFGCVLLEFAAWYLGGWGLVHKFVERRKVMNNPLFYGWNIDQFFELVGPPEGGGGRGHARVNPRVQQVIPPV